MIFQLIYKGQRFVLFADDTNIQIKAINEDVLNQKINSYAAGTSLVSCQTVSDKYREYYNNVVPHLEGQRRLKTSYLLTYLLHGAESYLRS